MSDIYTDLQNLIFSIRNGLPKEHLTPHEEALLYNEFGSKWERELYGDQTSDDDELEEF